MNLPITNETLVRSTVQLWPEEWRRLLAAMPVVPPPGQIATLLPLRQAIEAAVAGGGTTPIRLTFERSQVQALQAYANLVR